MRTLCRAVGLLVLCFAGSWATAAEGQIPWVADFGKACEMAADQRRLLLLHFYGDHCPPCERVEQHVFTQPQVVQAITKNYIPVKIHVEQQAQLAHKYQVRRWPTDVICTPSGLEVTRSVSPQTAVEYITMIDQVALQAGVGAARQWTGGIEGLAAAPMQQGAAHAHDFAQRVNASAQGHLNQGQVAVQGLSAQANAAAQGYIAQGQQQYAQAAQSFQQAAQDAQVAAGQAQQQLADAGQQFQGAAQQFNAAAAGVAANLRSAWQPPGESVEQHAPPSSGHEFAAAPPLVPAPVAAPAFSTQPHFETVGPGGYAVQPPSVQSPQVPPPQPPAFQSPQFAAGPPAAQPAAAVPPVAHVAAAPATGPIAPPASIPASQAPPSALDGYCPVTLLESMTWTKADPRFGVVHRNRTYLFASAAEQQRFLANPDRYAPVLDGCDPVHYAKTGQLIPGKRSCGITYNKQIFLFADEQSLAEFSKSPDAAKGYATVVYQAMMPQQPGTTYR